MILGKSTSKSYRNAANRLRAKGINIPTRVERCLDLVATLSRTHVAAYEGLVMPLQRGQPGQLLGTLAAKDTLDIVMPVCPPPPIAPHIFKPSITAEAAAGIRAANILVSNFADTVGTRVRPLVLIADTETDLESVMERAGGSEKYLDICGESAVLIEAELPEGAHATTFSRYFNERVGLSGGFHALQYKAEAAIRADMKQDPVFYDHMSKISAERAAKHQKILGRPEQDNELAVRYAAQYTALGDYVRSAADVDAVCNYPTPNSAFYNGADKPPVVVFESRLQRKMS